MATLDRWLLSTIFEQINDNMRETYRNVDHEMKLITQFITKKLINISDPHTIRLKLKKAIDRLQTLDQLVKQSNTEQENYFDTIVERIDMLSAEPNLQNVQQNPNFNITNDYVHKRVSWTLMEFLNRRGYINTAKQLAAKENLNNLADLELFTEVKHVSDQIKSGNLEGVLKWINNYRYKLNKLYIPLEDQVLAQRIINAAANDDMELVVKLIEQGGGKTDSPEIRKAITSCLKGINVNDTKDKLDSILKLYESAVAQAQGYSEYPLVHYILHAGFSAMKSKACRDCRAISCPSCCPDWSVYVEQVPTLHRLQSVLVCPITGQVMDDLNPPMASPDGIVYSYNALKCYTEEGIVTCPKTGHKHPFDSYTKLFIT